MSLLYIIDGYNLIKHSEFRRPDKKSRDDRLALLEFLRRNRLRASPRNRVIVVFDGFSGNLSFNHSPGIEVVFSGEESADERIKKIIEESGNTRNIIVVSDDKEIKFIIKSLGARAMGIAEFIHGKKKTQQPKDYSGEWELSYSSMHKINQELRKIWLK
jgi:predicted RNA-binding protein with PIN domain